MRWTAFCGGGLPWSVISFLLTTSEAELWWIGKPCESAILRDGKAKAVAEMSTKNSPDALEILEDLCIFKNRELYINRIQVLSHIMCVYTIYYVIRIPLTPRLRDVCVPTNQPFAFRAEKVLF